MTLPFALGLDIGGTKFAAAVIATDGSVVRQARHPTPVTADPDEMWAALLAAIDDVVAEPREIVAVGAGCGGPMRRDVGLVSPLNIPAWRDFPLVQRLRELVPGVPVVVHNDAIAMAFGEYAHGCGRGARAFLGVVVSTGVGGGLVLDGVPVDGPTGNAGHVGHVVVDPDGPKCACGGRGCLEAVARGPAVVAWARAQGWDGGSDGHALVGSARAGDALALAALTRAGQALGLACASTAALLDLDVIAIGGGLANARELLLGPAKAAFDRHAGLAFTRRCQLVAASLGGDAGLVGAGVLALRTIAGEQD